MKGPVEVTLSEKLYRVAYSARTADPGFTKKQLIEMNMGGCDSLVIVSIIRGNDNCEPWQGGKSFMVGSCDGRDGYEIPTAEYYQAMTSLAKYILESPDATKEMRHNCQKVIDDHRRMIGLKKDSEGNWTR